MQQQSLELESREIESLKKRVYDLELRITVHEEKCGLKNQMIEDRLRELAQKESETKKEVIDSRKELKREINERFSKVNTKLWAGLIAITALSLSIAGWSLSQLWSDSKPHYDSNYDIVIVYKI